MEAYPYLKKYRIVTINITPEHGVILKTETEEHPEHRTWWRDYETDFGAICQVVYSPTDGWIENEL